MFQPLREPDYAAVERMLIASFDVSEHKHFLPVWQTRSHETSLGIWRDDYLLAAALVRNQFLEYICVSDACRGSGIGTQLLQAVLAKVPALHLTPVNDLRVIRWYESQGFRRVGHVGEQPIYANEGVHISCSEQYATTYKQKVSRSRIRQ